MIPLLDPLLEALGLIQAAKTVNVAALPPGWMGFDIYGCPGTNASVSAGDLAWFDWCTQKTNLRFAGAYLEGTSLPPTTLTYPTNILFNGATRDMKRHWVDNVGALRTHGWGIAFWYVGYSQVDPLAKMPATIQHADFGALGTLHALHARMIVKDLNLGLDDATIYFDNEDGTGTDIVTPLKDYYTAFFAGLIDATLQDTRVNPATALPTLRPGMYVHASIAVSVLKQWPTVVIWQDDPMFYTRRYVSTGSNSTLTQILSPLPTGNYALVTVGTTMPVGRPAGRQFAQGAADAVPSSTVTGVHTYSGFDYDSSAVRDPAYPSGDPRVAIASGSGDGIVARGAFSPSTTQAQMAVQLLVSGAWQNVALPASNWVEPDAPLAGASYPSFTEQRLATFLNDGTIAVCQVDQPSPTWAALFAPMSPAPRRLRALDYALFKPAPTPDEQVYWIGSDRSIYGVRNTGTGWGGAVTVGGVLTVAPAACLTVACLQDVAVYLFTVDSSSLLTAISWTAATDTWPPSNVLNLETGTSAFLPMSALAAVSPGPKKMFVFGIGTDLTLKYVEYTAGATPAWGSVQRLGAAGDYVFVHSRIATLVVSATQVQIAVVTDTGDVRLHTLDGSSGAWKENPAAQVLGQPKANAPTKNYTRPAAAAISEPAYGWRINPFGDLALAYEPAPSPETGSYTAVYAAGLSTLNAVATLPVPAATFQQFTALLRYSLDPNNTGWQLYR